MKVYPNDMTNFFSRKYTRTFKFALSNNIIWYYWKYSSIMPQLLKKKPHDPAYNRSNDKFPKSVCNNEQQIMKKEKNFITLFLKISRIN